ncbi:MAG: class I SAM-dependent methyltransferase [Paracoccaceae bacterium]
MQRAESFDAWTAGQSYDHYMGRWSRMIAGEFLDWLDAPAKVDWLELGCGTGALTSAILGRCDPGSVLATDASGDFIAHAQAAITDPRAGFRTAVAEDLPADDESVDVVTSGLVLNFLPDRTAGLLEMQRVLRPGGLLSFYVWDYPGGGIGFIDAFWKAAASLDPEAARLDEGSRFPFCTRDSLARLCAEAGITAPELTAIEIVTEFLDFEAFWHPFTLGAGPAPGYCLSLPEEQRMALKAVLQERLGTDGPVHLRARAWAVKAKRPD